MREITSKIDGMIFLLNLFSVRTFSLCQNSFWFHNTAEPTWQEQTKKCVKREKKGSIDKNDVTFKLTINT